MRTDRMAPEEGDAGLQAARAKALELLNYGDRSEHELRDKLADRGFTAEQIDAAVEYAYSFHYLDDVRLAEHFIRHNRSSYSNLVLKQKLAQRGISSEDIDTAFDHLRAEADEIADIRQSRGLDAGGSQGGSADAACDDFDDPDGELTAALRALRKKLKGPMPDDRDAGRKILAYMYRKGFGPEVTRKALEILSREAE